MLHAVLDIAPDLIVLDFAVNSDTVERLKADGRTRHIPVIGLADIMRFAAGGSPLPRPAVGSGFPHVLVVDHDADTREVYAFALVRSGFRVSIAVSVTDALRKPVS